MKKLIPSRLCLVLILLLALVIPALLAGCTVEQAVYAGDKENGLPHGSGTKTYPNGTTFEGEFKQGYRHGEGIWVHSSGITYSGQWHSDRYHGRGILTIPKQYSYEGQWEQGVKEGLGLQTWEDGRRYEGQWKDGIIHGEGVMEYSDGSRYEGQWEGGRPHGTGSMYDPQDDRRSGIWEYGKLVYIPVETLALSTYSLTLDLKDDKYRLLAYTLPDDATDPEVTWSSNDPEIASIEEGYIVPQTPGKTEVTATATAEGLEATCRVKITAPPVAVTGVELERFFLVLRTGDDPYELEATIEPEDADNQTVTWHSENPEIASVSPDGLVTPHEVGETEITVETEDGGFTDTIRIIVRQPMFKLQD